MEKKICFFIGHRDASDDLRLQLAEAVERHITEFGVTEFIVGHYGNFDSMAASAVRSAKQQHPEVSLVLLLPYYPIKGLKEISTQYDVTFYPPDLESVPKPFAITRANEYMIRNCDYLICYNKGYVGNTRTILEMAEKLEKKGFLHIENLAEELD